jgi:hypothetical protein
MLVYGKIKGRSPSNITIEKCEFQPGLEGASTVQSLVIAGTGMEPPASEIEEACSFLADVGFEKAIDNKLTAAEMRPTIRKWPELSDMTIRVLSALVTVEGEGLVLGVGSVELA